MQINKCFYLINDELSLHQIQSAVRHEPPHFLVVLNQDLGYAVFNYQQLFKNAALVEKAGSLQTSLKEQSSLFKKPVSNFYNAENGRVLYKRGSLIGVLSEQERPKLIQPKDPPLTYAEKITGSHGQCHLRVGLKAVDSIDFVTVIWSDSNRQMLIGTEIIQPELPLEHLHFFDLPADGKNLQVLAFGNGRLLQSLSISYLPRTFRSPQHHDRFQINVEELPSHLGTRLHFTLYRNRELILKCDGPTLLDCRRESKRFSTACKQKQLRRYYDLQAAELTNRLMPRRLLTRLASIQSEQKEPDLIILSKNQLIPWEILLLPTTLTIIPQVLGTQFNVCRLVGERVPDTLLIDKLYFSKGGQLPLEELEGKVIQESSSIPLLPFSFDSHSKNASSTLSAFHFSTHADQDPVTGRPFLEHQQKGTIGLESLLDHLRKPGRPPGFVFLNGCFSGAQDLGLNTGRGWGKQLQEAGCPAFIGNLMPIWNLEIIQSIGPAFYRHFFQGIPISKACLQLRKSSSYCRGFVFYGHPETKACF